MEWTCSNLVSSRVEAIQQARWRFPCHRASANALARSLSSSQVATPSPSLQWSHLKPSLKCRCIAPLHLHSLGYLGPSDRQTIPLTSFGGLGATKFYWTHTQNLSASIHHKSCCCCRWQAAILCGCSNSGSSISNASCCCCCVAKAPLCGGPSLQIK